MVNSHPGTTVATASRRWSVLTWLMMVFAVPVPLAVVVAFLPQLQAIGEVSHWPWDEYGFFGWWLVPVSLALSAAFGATRPGEGSSRAVRVIGVLAVVTTVALFFNP